MKADNILGISPKHTKKYAGNEVYYYAVQKFKKINKNRLTTADDQIYSSQNGSIVTKSTTR